MLDVKVNKCYLKVVSDRKAETKSYYNQTNEVKEIDSQLRKQTRLLDRFWLILFIDKKIEFNFENFFDDFCNGTFLIEKPKFYNQIYSFNLHFEES